MASALGVNRLDFVIPPNSPTSGTQRDQTITQLKAMGIVSWDFWRYIDTASGNGGWGYYGIGYLANVDGTMTIATVSCFGMSNPPSGMDIGAFGDPGPGVIGWPAVSNMGWPHGIKTSGGGGGGISPPAGNNNYYVWRIAGNSTTAVADFTAAVAAVNNAVPGTTVRQGFKYVDTVSGAWQVWWIAYGAGSSEFAAAAATILANNNILYMVTCSGSPHPPSGSAQPAVALPAFTQVFTTLSAPLSFGPQR